LERVAIDDFAVKHGGQAHRKGAFSGSGRAYNCYQMRD
jgi:hypothetical protein